SHSEQGSQGQASQGERQRTELTHRCHPPRFVPTQTLQSCCAWYSVQGPAATSRAVHLRSPSPRPTCRQRRSTPCPVLWRCSFLSSSPSPSRPNQRERSPHPLGRRERCRRSPPVKGPSTRKRPGRGSRPSRRACPS